VVGPSCTDEFSCSLATIGSADSSCNAFASCSLATIGSADSSCKDDSSCNNANIGSVDSSCNDNASCLRAQLSGVDLINSCNDNIACKATARDGAFDELIDCCNDDNSQCKDKDGLDIINAGCVSYVNVYLMLVKKSNDSLSLIYKHMIA